MAIPLALAIGGGALLGGAAGFLGGSKGKKAQFDPYGTLNPEQRAMVQALGPQLTSAASAEAPRYGGQLTADMSPQESAFYNTGRANLMSGTLDSMLAEGSDPVARANAFRQGMSDPAYQNFRQNTLPGLVENAPASSSFRANLADRAMNTLNNDLAMQRFQYDSAAKDRALSAIGQTPNIQNYMAAPRIFQQAGLDRKYSDYVQGNQTKQNNISNALQFLGISTATYQPEQKDTRWSGMLSGALGGASLGAGIGGMFGGGGGAAAGASAGGGLRGGTGNYSNVAPQRVPSGGYGSLTF